MTDNASLPPADVQRPKPSLTDDELAVMAERWPAWAAEQPADIVASWATNDVLALIADLRASHARVKELEEHIADEVRDYLGG